MKVEMIDEVTGRTIYANKAQEELLLKIGRARHVKSEAKTKEVEEEEKPKKKKGKNTYKTRALKAED